MTTLLKTQKPLDRWAYDRIQPGSVGSVGDVLGQVRVRQSEPNMAFAWDPIFSGADEPFRGSNVQNGTQGSFTTNGMGARIIDGLWDGVRDFKTQYGWIHQDVSAPDKLVTPVDMPAPSYSWCNRQAQVQKAKVTGENFLPLPGGFQPTPGSLPRGGQVPRITDQEMPEDGLVTNGRPTALLGLGSGRVDSRGIAPTTRIKAETDLLGRIKHLTRR